MDLNFEPDIPEDFDAFWATIAEEARSAPLDFHRDLEVKYAGEHHDVETFSFRGISGETLYGWIAIPHGGARRERAFLWVPPYGRESLLPNAYGTREGYVSLSFNFFGHEAFHQETYTPARGYFSEGAEDPETWIFRRMFQNAFIAARVLQSIPEADEDRIAAMGMSQGAGISIWLGSWCPIIRCVCADMPFLGAMPVVFARGVHRYPLKELLDFWATIPIGEQRVMNTISYYDTQHQATRCSVPTQVSLGEKDPSVRPPNAVAVFDALPGEKRLIRYDWGHDWTPEMVTNNVEWLESHLR